MENDGLYKKLTEYSKANILPMHMPGHKRRECLGVDPHSIDITEISGFDNLHDAKGVIKEEQTRLAKIYGADDAYILVNGSTCGNLAMLYATVGQGDTVVMEKNSHKSVYNAVELIGCDKVFLDDVTDFSGATAVIVTYPSYIGETMDIEALAKKAHEAGAYFIVDSAHGAHLGFSDFFPANAIALGADAVVISLHKTLPALTQTAALLLSGDRISRKKIEHALDIFETSSPSYVLMASVSRCIDFLENDAKGQFGDYAKRLVDFYKSVSGLSVLKVIDKGSIEKDDPSKIILSSKNTAITGFDLFTHLRDDYGIECEMYGSDYVLMLSTVMDTKDDFKRLRDAIVSLDDRASRGDIELAIHDDVRYNEIMKLEVGDVSPYTITVYPPSVPIVMENEVVAEEHLRQIKNAVDTGLNIIVR